jgi:plasmid stabilization system protein ParE
MTKPEVILKPQAREDIKQIAAYIKEDSPQSSTAFRQTLENIYEVLLELPASHNPQLTINSTYPQRTGWNSSEVRAGVWTVFGFAALILGNRGKEGSGSRSSPRASPSVLRDLPRPLRPAPRGRTARVGRHHPGVARQHNRRFVCDFFHRTGTETFRRKDDLPIVTALKA